MNRHLEVFKLVSEILFHPDSAELTRRVGAAEASIPDLWVAMLSVANAHLVTGAFWSALRSSPLLEAVPEDVIEYLRSFHALNRERNESVAVQLEECTIALNRQGIEPMPIKGAAYVVSRLHSDIGDRFFSDIDLLLPLGAERDAAAVFRELGYTESPEVDFDHITHHHLPPLVRDDLPVAVELHTAPVPSFAQAALPTAEIWSGASPVRAGDARFMSASPTDAVTLSFVHTEIVDRYLSLYFMPLRPFLDLFRLIERHRDEIDWSVIRSRAESADASTALLRYLHVLKRLTGIMPVPDLEFSPAEQRHFELCESAIRWPAISRWLLRLDRFSRRRIQIHYGETRLGRVNAHRLRELREMLQRALKH